MSAVEGVGWTTVVVAAVVALACAVQAWWRQSKKSRGSGPLPPGPKGLPILGHFHMIGKSPHRDLQQLAKQYGPVMYLKFGFVDNIVVSSPQAAEQFLKTHDHVFASRPPLEYAKFTLYEQRDMIFAEYGDYWRKMRKFCTLELLSNHKLNSFKSTRREEVGLLMESIGRAARDGVGVGVDLSDMVASMNAEMTCEMVFGKKYSDKDIDERGFKAVIREGMELTTTPNLADYFPYIGALDLQGLRRRLKAVGKVYDEFLEKVIDEHVDVEVEGRRQRQNRDFVDIMLGFMESEEAEFRLDRPQIKAIMLDMLVAGMDTSSAAIEWAVSELLRHPKVMKKVQKELEEVVGMDRVVEESDLERLKYLDMVVKETMRLHPVAPLLLPHEAVEDCVINGFHIPKKSRITINVWAIGRDPKVWSDAEKFMPERFVGSDVDVRGQHFQLLPFGSGRRSCPGMQMGLTVVRLVVAQLMHCFDWKLPNGMLPVELDMAEDFGIVACRAKHLFAVPTPRRHN